MRHAERHLVIGGARSGKTRHALALAQAAQQDRAVPVVYVATAEAGDQEMSARIERHRAERPESWRTVEAPRRLAASLQEVDADTVVVVDCLTLWLSNALLVDFREESPLAELPSWNLERQPFLDFLAACRHRIVLVSNEVGSGLVPVSPLARRFQDEQGRLNQSVASLCERVTLVVAGVPLVMKAE